MKRIELEWIGEAKWNPDVGDKKKGDQFWAYENIANSLIEQGLAKKLERGGQKKGGKE